MARLMLSCCMFSDLAARIAPRSRGLVSGSPPPFLAAMLISLIRRVKILPRLASSAPFLCLIVAHFEWPDMEIPRSIDVDCAYQSYVWIRPGRRLEDSLHYLRIASKPMQTNRNYSTVAAVLCALCESLAILAVKGC